MTDLSRLRCARQHVSRPAATPADAVRRLLAVQAQDLGQASWAVALRSTGRSDALASALADGAVVRTWPMRGTLHLVAAADARWMLALLAPRAMRGLAGRRAALGLDDDTVERARRRLRDHLGRVGAATREELQAALAAGGVSPEGQRGYHLLSTLAQEGLLVQGALRDGEPTFSLLDDRVPRAPSLSDADAAGELARRYVDGHGPVTAEDLAWWSGLPVTACRAALAACGARRDGPWFLPDDTDAPPTGTHLLPGFDELHLGYRDRAAILDPAHADLVCPGGNGVFRPTVLADGRMRGTWRPRKRRRDVDVDVAWFEGPDPRPDPASVRAASERWAAFQGLPLRAASPLTAPDR